MTVLRVARSGPHERDDEQVLEWARIVLSGVAPIPWRTHAAEKILAGQGLQETISEAAAAATDGAEPLLAMA